ncbi:MAG: Outer membrane protein assembly factor BamA [Elusimicrobia bacterium]|nr:Outer membrane protein assembly factor BamA [Elusimicrobiota bacterium]
MIGRIVVNRKNVFDTGTAIDHRFPYSWANKLHIVTQETYIRQELLFKEGDEFNPELIKESERILRGRPIFRYVNVIPQTPYDGRVDILIQTEDVWTTSVQMSYSVAGGRNSYGIGFLEKNFLGQGKVLGAFLRKNIDRTTRGFSYQDPQLFGTRWDLFGGYGKDEKGREWEGNLERPYFSALSRHSEGVSIVDREDEGRMFSGGEEVASFGQKTREMRIFSSVALLAKQKHTLRISLAHEHNIDEFYDVQGPAAPTLPSKRAINPVLLGFDYEKYIFHKVRGVTTFDRDEDINLGEMISFEGGPSNKHFGATDDSVVLRLTAGKTFHFQENQVWFNLLKMDGRQEEEAVRDGVMRIRSQYFLLNWMPENTASLRGEYIHSKNLDPEKQFLLGGENGLRGYSVRQFSGPNKMLLALENRQVVLYEWLHLVNIGWALFADTGAVWADGVFPKFPQFKSDVGLGLRLAPSRSVDPGLIRIDVAYALQDNDRKSRFVLNIGADLSFGDRRVRKFDQ